MAANELADRIAVLDQGKLVAEGTADELKRRVPGGHIRLQFADPAGLDAAARALDGSTRDDDDALTLQVPSDGGVRSLRALLDRLDNASIEVDGLSVHTPDLDIVQLLPFLSSAFVSPNAMSPAVRWFVKNEPFTPIIDTWRGLLLGTPVGNSSILAVVWCVGLALAGYMGERLDPRGFLVLERREHPSGRLQRAVQVVVVLAEIAGHLVGHARHQWVVAVAQHQER